ncbi:hypothetical protein CP98_02032 [Sphingobium yanoikuyae]|uniref:Uncharacterized protein n=1 Tax=Sphingobium yanoikuyae TaxID=13690 RepID=A0A084ENG8_SPHYA|nr:hypothetical protein CP98_02032 [Sphingobium yanoikuyae]
MKTFRLVIAKDYCPISVAGRPEYSSHWQTVCYQEGSFAAKSSYKPNSLNPG